MANGNPSPNSKFDLEKRLRERHDRQILIGNREFHPARETTESRAADRKLAREQARVNSALEKAAENEDFDQLEELQVEQERLLYSIVTGRLVDEHDVKPEIEWLAEHLPIGQVTPLLDFLEGEQAASTDPS